MRNVIARRSYSSRGILEALEDIAGTGDVTDGGIAFDEQVGDVGGQVDTRRLQACHIRGNEIHAPVGDKDVDHGLVSNGVRKRRRRAACAGVGGDGLENLDGLVQVFANTAPGVDERGPVRSLDGNTLVVLEFTEHPVHCRGVHRLNCTVSVKEELRRRSVGAIEQLKSYSLCMYARKG